MVETVRLLDLDAKIKPGRIADQMGRHLVDTANGTGCRITDRTLPDVDRHAIAEI